MTITPHSRTLPPVTDTRSCAVCTRVRRRPCQESTCAICCVNPIRTPKRVIRLEFRGSVRTRPPVAPINPCRRYLSNIRLCHAPGNIAQPLRSRLVRNLCSLLACVRRCNCALVVAARWCAFVFVAHLSALVFAERWCALVIAARSCSHTNTVQSIRLIPRS